MFVNCLSSMLSFAQRQLNGSPPFYPTNSVLILLEHFCYYSEANSSSGSNSLDKRQNFLAKTDKEHQKRLARIHDTISNAKAPYRRQGEGTNLAFPNKIGVHGYDPEMDVKKLISITPGFLKSNLKASSREFLNSFDLEKKEVFENQGMLSDGETRIEHHFNTPDALNLWRLGCDSDWSQGYSTCELVNSDRDTGIFRGNLSTKLVKDGKTERAGWALMKLNDKRSFGRKKFFSRWKSFSHLLIKCRGDGRSYKIMIYCPLHFDVTWGDTWSHPLHTHGGPYWQYETIPFSKFFHTVYGRIQDRQYPLNLYHASSIGIALMDRIDGEFTLELDFIGVTHDHSHKEKFAYETYTLPVFYPSGI